MYPKYNPKDIESKWRRKWQIANLYRASDSEDKPKYYCLDFFHIDQEWPSCDPELAEEEFTQIPIKVNGKVGDLVEVPFFAGRSEVEAAAFNLPKIKQLRKKGQGVEVIYMPDKIINILTKHRNGG